MEPIFRKEYHEYTRDLDFIKLYKEQCMTYAGIQDRNLDQEDFKQFLEKTLSPNGEYPIFNPRMRMIIKDENNDRQLSQTTAIDYFRSITKNDLKFAPTFTTYQPEHRMRSIEASFLDVGMDRRSKEKKLKFQAKERGDSYMANHHDLMQQMYKILNNSSSGAKAVQGTILYNQTGHSTLTSICRSETSFANSINEKMLGGFRHYFNVDVVINNILAVLTFTNLKEVEHTLQTYNMHYVTNEELLWAIKRSTDLYWQSPKAFVVIEEFVNKLTPLECSAYLYNSDLFMIRQFNDKLIRDMFTKLLSYKDLAPLPLEEAEYWIKHMDSDIAAFVVIYLSELSNGESIKTAMLNNPSIIPIVGATVKNVFDVFEEYRLLIKTFLVTEIMPFESSRLPEMMRAVVLGSDTDSSLFALDTFWVNWYCGEVVHNKVADDIVATTVFITSMHVAHVLGMMTGILNVVTEKRPLIAMKNEYAFSSFTTTSRGKHYFAKKFAQEGVLIPSKKKEAEIKGVGLKHTKVPKHITKGFHDKLHFVMEAIETDQQISLLEMVKSIAEIEYNVYDSIRRGVSEYLQRGKIKVKEAYKTEDSVYKRGYEFWEAVFADKYGHTVEPPFDCIKVSTTVDTRNRFMAWLSLIEDKALAERLLTWIDNENGGKPMSTFYIPQAVANTSGIPAELMMVMQPRKLVYQITSPYYLLLESFRLYMTNDHVTKLCSDYIPDWSIPVSLFDNND